MLNKYHCFFIFVSAFLFISFSQVNAQSLKKEKIATERAVLKENNKIMRVEFKDSLKKIIDGKKTILLTRIDNKMIIMNKNRVGKMSLTLEKLKNILNRLTVKVNTTQSAGQDITQAEKAIAAAKLAITTAQDAIEAQTAKEYIIRITTENNLKNNAGAVVSQLEADLKATNKTVIDAKQAVQNAVREVAKLQPIKVTITPTIGAL